jgi:organic hydroperoxide reductase OsmC/OhrA
MASVAALRSGRVATSHSYEVAVQWTGDRGCGTRSYRAYDRDHEVRGAAKPPILGSSDPAFRGDPRRWSPEELLVAAVAQCHMLWYLHLAAASGIVVVSYYDRSTGVMVEDDDGGGQFESVTLRPVVAVTEQSMLARGLALHAEVGPKCFVARSVNFPVYHEPILSVA